MLTAVFPEKLHSYCSNLIASFDSIDQKRQAKLIEVSEYIGAQLESGAEAKLNVICTHNSRRSHIGQVWLEIAAFWYKIKKVSSFSGGTEATAFNERSVEALRRAGIPIKKVSQGSNPKYTIDLEFSSSLPKFSKKYNDESNPQKDFAAILVCNSAAEACPVVFGAQKRFSIQYLDPKRFDDTDQELEAYDETVERIGKEMFFIMKNVRS